MPLKPIENFPAGGVSLRDNPLAYPPDRYLMLKNFWPQTNGELRLRDGYSLYATGLQSNIAIHSITGIVGPGPDYKRLIVFWQGTIPYLLDPATRSVTAPAVRGAAIRSSDRFCYFSTGKYLYAFNGTDAKFFDGLVWRDVGLPRLTKDQADAVVVSEGLASISASDAAAVGVSAVSGGGWLRTDKYGEFVYLAMFDTATNELAGSVLPLGGLRVALTPGQRISLATMPVPSPSTVVKIPLLTDDGGTKGKPIQNPTAFDHPDSLTFSKEDPTTVHAHCNNAPHLLATGDLIAFRIVSGADTPPTAGPFAVTVIDSLNFSFQVKEDAVDSYAAFTECFKLLAYSNAATSGYINDHRFAMSGMIADGMEEESTGLAASTIGGVQPGYQFYMAIRNKVTQHVGNRQKIGARLVNSSRCNVVLSGYPEVQLTDDEWELLVGRTGDGAEVPYAVIDENGDYVTADQSGVEQITQQDDIALARVSNVVTASFRYPGIVGHRPPTIPSGSLVTVTLSPAQNFDGNFIVESSATNVVGSEWVITLTWIQSGTDDTGTGTVEVLTAPQPTVIKASNIDGDTELPARNFPPPGTLDYNDQIAPDSPVSGTFRRAWVESDHCCGNLDGSPFVYRSGSAADMREGKFVGLPEQSWAPSDVETFPTAAPVSCGQSYLEQSLVYSVEDSAVLVELASELGWQGPWNLGGAGQHAYTRGWNNLPFVLTGEKQLATAGSDGPIPISDEYEAALLAKIGDQYLSETEMIYVRQPKKRVEVLRINARDAGGIPFAVIHDFNLRDSRSPYGQAYEEDLAGPVQFSELWSPVQLNATRNSGLVSVSRTFTVPPLLPKVGDEAVISGGTTFDGTFQIESVEVTDEPPPSLNRTVVVKWSQEGADETALTTVEIKSSGSPHTLAAVRDENSKPIVLAGAADGNIYLLYDGISDAGEFFTGDALGLKYIGPQRSGVKYLSWYGDKSAEFFVAKKLTTPASTDEMSALCSNPSAAVQEVQDDEGSNHWQVAVTDEIEMRHCYLWIRLTGRATDDDGNANTMELNDPPHMPVETYGRILMVTPEMGAQNPR